MARHQVEKWEFSMQSSSLELKEEQVWSSMIREHGGFKRQRMLRQQVVTKKQQLAAKERKEQLRVCALTWLYLTSHQQEGRSDMCNTKTRIWCKQQEQSKGIKLCRCSVRKCLVG